MRRNNPPFKITKRQVRKIIDSVGVEVDKLSNVKSKLVENAESFDVIGECCDKIADSVTVLNGRVSLLKMMFEWRQQIVKEMKERRNASSNV